MRRLALVAVLVVAGCNRRDPNAPTGAYMETRQSDPTAMPPPRPTAWPGASLSNGPGAGSGPSASRPATGQGPARPQVTTIAARRIVIRWLGCPGSNPSITRTESEARAFAEELRRRAKAGEDFAELATKHSDDASKSRGGALGRFSRGDVAGTTVAAAFELAIGDVSEVIRADDGFHLFLRTE